MGHAYKARLAQALIGVGVVAAGAEPLSGYGTKNIFTRAEFDAACAAAP